MASFTVYRMSDGKIMRYGYCDHYDLPMQAEDGELVHEGEAIRDDLFYMPAGVKTPRPELDIPREFTIEADGEDAVSFDLPPGSQVFCRALDQEWLDEDEFYFSTEVPGVYEFRIEPAFPYKEDVRVTINAV